ncbi:MAG: relaxase/mobilization nuclease domain-containing protein [Hyphomicrobiaceae bacterium]
MILKASQRGGGKQLAQHLLRRDDNEHVEIHDIRGFVSDDLLGALKEAHAISKATKCRQFLFSVSLNPPPQERVEIGIFEDAIARIEEKNGLTGQPRIVVFHEKEGRRHAHAVWSRIDADTMTARNLPHFKLKLRDLSRELYLENGWKMPPGLMNSREADPRNFTLAEWHQAKRAGFAARDLKDMMQECWASSDNARSFTQALKARGFTIARGDRRGHVAISPEGEVFSLARAVGKTTKDVAKRLGDPAKLPGVADARAQLASDLTQTFQRHRMEADQQKRQQLAPLDLRRKEMAQSHRGERVRLEGGQQKRWLAESQDRSARFAGGVRGLWNRLTGQHAEIQKRNEREAYLALARDRAQRQALIETQMTERQALQTQIKAIRDRHAGLLRDLRSDHQQVKRTLSGPAVMKDFEAQAKPAPVKAAPAKSLKESGVATPKERLEKLRGRGGQAAEPNSAAPAPTPMQRLERSREARPDESAPRPPRNRTPDRER